MNRTEFMRQLEKLLHDIPVGEREEAIQYYNDYFDDAGVEREPDVIESLGNPARVARTIQKELYDNEEAAKRQVLASDRVLAKYEASKSDNAVPKLYFGAVDVETYARADGNAGDTYRSQMSWSSAEERGDRFTKSDTRNKDESTKHHGDPLNSDPSETAGDSSRYSDPSETAGDSSGYSDPSEATGDSSRYRDPSEAAGDSSRYSDPSETADDSNKYGDPILTATNSNKYSNLKDKGINKNGGSNGADGSPVSSGGSKKTYVIIAIIIGCVVLLPTLIGFLGSIFGAVIGIIAGWFGLILGFGITALSLFVASVVLMIIGVVMALSNPILGIGLIGGGLFALGLGFLFLMLTIWMAGTATPWLIRGLKKLFDSLYQLIRKHKR
jgi:uncharacterized membrane protein